MEAQNECLVQEIMALLKQKPVFNWIPQAGITHNGGDHLDSSNDPVGAKTKTKIDAHDPKKSAGMAKKKLVCSRAWNPSGPLDNPHMKSSYSPTRRTVPRGPTVPKAQYGQFYSLDRGFVESDFYIKSHRERGNPMADIYQIQADYEDSIAFEKFLSGGPKSGNEFDYGNVVIHNNRCEDETRRSPVQSTELISRPSSC